MNLMVGALAILSAVVLTGTAVSLFALHRAHTLLRELRHKPHAEGDDQVAGREEVRELRSAVEALAAQVHELHKVPPAAVPDPGAARPGLNLSRRSQALRMHRLGESAGQISGALQVPRQEVDLLLKVHRIVLSRV